MILLDTFIQDHLSRKLQRHQEGECAGIECPWCEYEKELLEEKSNSRQGVVA